MLSFDWLSLSFMLLMLLQATHTYHASYASHTSFIGTTYRKPLITFLSKEKRFKIFELLHGFVCSGSTQVGSSFSEICPLHSIHLFVGWKL